MFIPPAPPRLPPLQTRFGPTGCPMILHLPADDVVNVPHQKASPPCHAPQLRAAMSDLFRRLTGTEMPQTLVNQRRFVWRGAGAILVGEARDDPAFAADPRLMDRDTFLAMVSETKYVKRGCRPTGRREWAGGTSLPLL